jgi:hypothetical protein
MAGESAPRYGHALMVIVSMLLLGFTCSAVADPAGRGPAFCSREPVRDYESPFSRMPSVRVFPRSGRLPFAPRTVTVGVPATKILVPGESLEISYGLDVPSGSSFSHRFRWRINSQLMRVSASGRKRRSIARRAELLNTSNPSAIDEAGFSYSLSREPGFYLVRIQFRGRGGELLGRYGEYFRVVRPTSETELVAERTTVQEGEQLAFKIENRGTSRISFGESFSVEREAGGQWFPLNLQLGPWHALRLGLGAGEVGACQRLDITRRLRPGQYRVRKALLSPSRRLEVGFVVAP